jgi:hypothetical protein
VLGMVERGGRVRMMHLADFKAQRLRGAIREHMTARRDS